MNQYSTDALTRTGVFEISTFDAKGDLYCHSIYDTATINTTCQK